MNNYLQRLVGAFIPCVMLGIAVALIIGFFVVFSYILLWGVLIGIVLWIAACVKAYFFPDHTKLNTRGRIIEYKKNRD